MLIIDFAHRTGNKKISIVSDELSKMKRTVIRDFLAIMQDWNMLNYGTWNKTENTFTFNNGTFIEFLGLDTHDVGKGMRRDLVYFNEANKLKLESYRQVASRSKLNIIDFNPDAKFWGHDLMTENNFIQLTFKDNEYLPETEVQSILEYYEKGYNADGSIKNEYWANIWNIYGLGNIGSVEGRIYYWNKISDKEFHELKVTSYYGVDWGAVDPFAVVECKYYDGNLYLREINYASENDIRQKLTTTETAQTSGTDEGLVSWLFHKWQIPKNSIIVCDSNRPNKILSLRHAGWEYAHAIGAKSKLLDRINTLQSLNIYYTDNSTNIEFEQFNYCYAKDKFGKSLEVPTDANNHTIDAIAYAVQAMFNDGLIKNI